MLEVRQQVRLSFARLLDICLDSVKHRLLRSVVTVLIVLLAITFLSSIMMDGYLGRATRDTIRLRTDRIAAYSGFLRKTSQVGSADALVRFAAQLSPSSADFANLTGWGEFTHDEAIAFTAQSRLAALFLDFFDRIPLGRRVLLVEGEDGLAILDWLVDQKNRDLFVERLSGMRSIHMPTDMAQFNALLATWPDHREELAGITLRYGETVKRISDFSGPLGIGDKLSDAAATETVNHFFEEISKMGLSVDAAAIPDIVNGQKHQTDLSWAHDQLRKTPIRRGWYREFSERFSPGRALISCAIMSGRVEWIETTLRDADLSDGFDKDRFLSIATAHQEQQDLLAKERQLTDRYGSAKALSSKTVWLMCVSFLVCVVGIANAMLMSVLERFKEIATMKCLGARNGTIAFLFVTESTIIGIIGGIVGIVMGLVLVFVRLTTQFGGLVLERFPVHDTVMALGVCFCCSLLLATVAAIYPAWVASRMAPMEAMRVD